MAIIKSAPVADKDYRYHCGHIEVAVAKFFNPRQNIIVPNISWGLNIHECDLLVLTQSGYAYEIEIKVSAGDLKADAKKGHAHRSNKIKLLYFAVPNYLLAYKEFIPVHAGIIAVQRVNGGNQVAIVRAPHANKNAGKWDDRQKIELMRLSTMRIWTLKETLHNRY